MRGAWLGAVVWMAACSATRAERAADVQALDAIAERYVKLVLAMGGHDDAYVDAYFGPAEWKMEAEARPRPLEAVIADATGAITALGAPTAGSAPEAMRRRYLLRQLQALRTRAELMQGRIMTFDEEARALYDVEPPRMSVETLDAIVAELERALPGEGPLYERYERLRKRFELPPDRLDAVLREGLRECRARTLRHVKLPEAESLTVEYVRDQPWGGYNWYQGGFQSLVQVNTTMPTHVGRGVALGCHEGYPGHHTYNVLLEQHFARARGWVEFTVFPLFTPQSLISEGAANYAVDLAFPDVEERARFEAERIFPLAGFAPEEARPFYAVQAIFKNLEYAWTEAARGRLEAKWSPERTAEFLTRYTLAPPDRARAQVDFIDGNRSYVINYYLGRRVVEDYVERVGGADHEARWRVFIDLLSSARLPADLVAR